MTSTTGATTMATKICLGRVKKDYKDGMLAGQTIYITEHDWNALGYFQFGYIGNMRLHAHFESLLTEYHYSDVFEGPARYSERNWYIILDLFKQAYILDHCADVYKVGGHVSSDPITNLIVNQEMRKKIFVDLEKVLDKVWEYLVHHTVDAENNV
jgi:hypothetical protein